MGNPGACVRAGEDGCVYQVCSGGLQTCPRAGHLDRILGHTKVSVWQPSVAHGCARICACTLM